MHGWHALLTPTILSQMACIVCTTYYIVWPGQYRCLIAHDAACSPAVLAAASAALVAHIFQSKLPSKSASKLDEFNAITCASNASADPITSPHRTLYSCTACWQLTQPVVQPQTSCPPPPTHTTTTPKQRLPPTNKPVAACAQLCISCIPRCSTQPPAPHLSDRAAASAHQ
jgi:hypothetical protein